MAFLYPSYFPFCVYNGNDDVNLAVGNGSHYPVGMSLEDAMALYWKAASFRFVETWSTTRNLTGTTVLGTTDVILTPNGFLDTMSSVSCGLTMEASWPSGTFQIFFPLATNPGPVYFSDMLYLYLFQHLKIVYKNDLYYPQITFAREGNLGQNYVSWYSFNNQEGGDILGYAYPASITINNNKYIFNMYSSEDTTQTQYANTATDITIYNERLHS